MITTTDDTAVYILKTIAQTLLPPASGALPPDAEMHAALSHLCEDPGKTAVTEGDLARAALDLLAQDPEFAEPIRMMAGTSDIAITAGKRYTDPGTIALIHAALLGLQTRVKFKAESGGKWSAAVEKKAAGDAVLKTLVQRLLVFLDK